MLNFVEISKFYLGKSVQIQSYEFLVRWNVFDRGSILYMWKQTLTDKLKKRIHKCESEVTNKEDIYQTKYKFFWTRVTYWNYWWWWWDICVISITHVCCIFRMPCCVKCMIHRGFVYYIVADVTLIECVSSSFV